MPVFGRRGAPVDEQAGAVAWLDRRLGDAIVGQLVVEVGDLHRPEATAATRFVLAPTPEQRTVRSFWPRPRTNRAPGQSNRLALPGRRGTATPMCS